MGMETKPYNLQSPEAIAKEYGGNKMKIAQAAQIGLLDPTAAVLAGMFIDRMRGAQQQEQAPQATVAQQVLAPQPAAPQAPAGAGLGATPQAAQLAAAYPADGAPPPIPGPSMPQQEPVMASDGGLMALPVDDALFQPSYNSGGIVAFAAGSEGMPIQGEGVVDERERIRLRREMQARFAANPQMIQNLANMSPDDMRQALGEVVITPVPAPDPMEVRDMREVTGEGFGDVTRPSIGRGAVLAQDASGTRELLESSSPPLSATPTTSTAPAVVDRGPTANVAPATTPSDKQVADAAIAADPEAAEAAVKKGGIPGLEAYVQQYKDLIGAVPEGEGLKEYKEYLKSLPGELDKRKKEDLWGALAQFGFNLAGSQSPYFLQAAGQAGAQTMPAITGALKERRAAESEARKGRAELDRMTRAEEIKAVEGGVKLYSDEQTRESQLAAARMAANKPTDMRNYVNDYVAAARASGDTQTPESVLSQRGAEQYLKLYSASEARAAAALSQASTAATQAETNIQDRARDNVDGSLAKNWNSPENKRIRELQKQDRKEGTNTAQAYVQSLYAAEENRIRGSGGGGGTPPPPAPAPSASPAPRPGAANAAPRPGAPATIPQPAITMLKNNPTPQAKKQFDQVFGAGAADRVLAGK
jgi:hypothetical protein